MTDYTKLVEASRHCISDPYGFVECDGCPVFCKGIDCQNDLHNDAAAAIEALQAEVAFYKKRVCESCGVCPDDMSDPNNCEIAGHGMWVGVNPLVDSVQCSICGGMLYSKELETPYCPYCGAKMEAQDDNTQGLD